MSKNVRGRGLAHDRAPSTTRRPERGREMRKKRLAPAAGALGVAVTILALSVAGGASSRMSTTYNVSATLDTNHEVPAPADAVGAKGTLKAKLTLNGKKSSFVWTLSFSHLSGKATASHLHYGKPGKAGLVALPLCVPCAQSPSHGEYRGPYVATQAFVKAILHGGMYVNIHTKRNPKGEIRGQVKVAPA
jgi:hypothetical protein